LNSEIERCFVNSNWLEMTLIFTGVEEKNFQNSGAPA